jgi:hypothetical protein
MIVADVRPVAARQAVTVQARAAPLVAVPRMDEVMQAHQNIRVAARTAGAFAARVTQTLQDGSYRRADVFGASAAAEAQLAAERRASQWRAAEARAAAALQAAAEAAGATIRGVTAAQAAEDAAAWLELRRQTVAAPPAAAAAHVRVAAMASRPTAPAHLLAYVYSLLLRIFVGVTCLLHAVAAATVSRRSPLVAAAAAPARAAAAPLPSRQPAADWPFAPLPLQQPAAAPSMQPAAAAESDDDVCSVCLEQLADKAVRVLTCGHKGCAPCFNRWELAAGHRAACPLCRSPMTDRLS